MKTTFLFRYQTYAGPKSTALITLLSNQYYLVSFMLILDLDQYRYEFEDRSDLLFSTIVSDKRREFSCKDLNHKSSTRSLKANLEGKNVHCPTHVLFAKFGDLWLTSWEEIYLNTVIAIMSQTERRFHCLILGCT